MNGYVKQVEIRWSDLDPNFHVRHSVYYDLGAYSRISYLNEQGLTPAFMTEHRFGPILFREEAVFKKEIRIGDTLTIDLKLCKARKDQSRWSFRHEIVKNGDVLAAILTVDGAWMDVVKRKLAAPPELARQVFDNMPLTDDFEWI